jgi:uncharacterized protein
MDLANNQDMPNYFRNKSTSSKFFFLLGIILISILVFSLGSSFIVEIIYGINLSDISATSPSLENVHYVNALKLMQLMNSFGLFIVPSFLFAFLFYDKALFFLKLSNRTALVFYLLVPVIMVSSVPLINFLAQLNLKMQLPEMLQTLEQWMKIQETSAEKITKAFLIAETLPVLLYNILLIAILPAIGEELLFRGILQNLFTTVWKNKHLGIWISAILFSALHMQFYGFVPRMMMGVLFGYLLVWTNSLWVPILAHFFNNATAVVSHHLMNKGKISRDMEEIGASDSDSLFLVSGAVALGLILYFIYSNRAEVLKKHPEISE